MNIGKKKLWCQGKTFQERHMASEASRQTDEWRKIIFYDPNNPLRLSGITKTLAQTPGPDLALQIWCLILNS